MKNAHYVYIDIMKAIAIVCVIAGHIFSKVHLKAFIYGFHMPLFFIISGVFFQQRGIESCVKRNIRNYIFPYLVTGIIIILIRCIMAASTGEDWIRTGIDWISAVGYGLSSTKIAGAHPDIPVIGGIWFLEALFWCSLETELLIQMMDEKKRKLVIVSLGAAAVIAGRYIWLPFNILPGVTAAVFYYLGHLYRKALLTEKSCDKKTLLISFLTFCVFVAFSVFRHSFLNIAICQFPLYGFDVIEGAAGTVSVFCISKLIEKNCRVSASILSKTGKNSLWILCVHIILLDCVDMRHLLGLFAPKANNSISIFLIHFFIDIFIVVLLKEIYEAARCKEFAVKRTRN